MTSIATTCMIDDTFLQQICAQAVKEDFSASVLLFILIFLVRACLREEALDSEIIFLHIRQI